MRQAAEQRKILLANYGPSVLKDGEPYGDLRGMRLWMTYLHHRWSIDAGVRYIGGMYTNYAVKGESIPPTQIVPAAKQREILGLLLDDVDPASLAIPESLLVKPDGGCGSRAGRRRKIGPTGPGKHGVIDGLCLRSSGGGANDCRVVFDQLFEPADSGSSGWIRGSAAGCSDLAGSD